MQGTARTLSSLLSVLNILISHEEASVLDLSQKGEKRGYEHVSSNEVFKL